MDERVFQGMEYVYEVYQAGSFRQAAENLYISQPSISASVRRIEERIGCPLFDRSVKPLRLTQCGRKYIEAVEQVQRLEREFTEYVSDWNGLKHGRLVLGGSSMFASLVLPPLIRRFRRDFPEVELLVLLVFGSMSAMAGADAADPYMLFTDLLDGRSVTLTVTTEEAELPDDLPVPGEMVWSAVRQEKALVLTIICDGECMVSAVLDENGVTLETVLEELPCFTCTWDALSPRISLTNEGEISILKVSLTGPEQELINFTVKITGTETDAYSVSFQAGLITGPGVIYGIYDDFSAENGAAERSAAYTWDESMLSAEGEGEETCTEEESVLMITRQECLTVLLDDDEIGTISLHSVLMIG